ncbi:MAG: hypothetical protein P1P89_15115 [Desulfobacterales bacterium]|nr:hypothetical protein [Desulfobacterales bacterium]
MPIEPQGEDLRKAVKWISEEHLDNPNKKARQLIEAACLKFNLSPKDADFLARCLKEAEGR